MRWNHALGRDNTGAKFMKIENIFHVQENRPVGFNGSYEGQVIKEIRKLIRNLDHAGT